MLIAEDTKFILSIIIIYQQVMRPSPFCTRSHIQLQAFTTRGMHDPQHSIAGILTKFSLFLRDSYKLHVHYIRRQNAVDCRHFIMHKYNTKSPSAVHVIECAEYAANVPVYHIVRSEYARNTTGHAQWVKAYEWRPFLIDQRCHLSSAQDMLPLEYTTFNRRQSTHSLMVPSFNYDWRRPFTECDSLCRGLGLITYE